ncbi:MULTISPECIES: hypothetical protein [Clostridium]|uniref:hypothetical protein n=1 Tax=Clostridium sp. ATCC 25772 TaxID=1676991 RepID=UPI00078071B2|nr:hypothetical protein [Clostridium sp. ATCC 25772]
MILEAKMRDLKLKGKKFINNGETMGIIIRNDNSQIPIAIKCSDMDKFLSRFGDYSNIVLNVEGENINTKIQNVERHVTLHNPIHVEFKEISI